MACARGTTWTKGEVDAWYSEHGFNAAVDSVTSQVVITDPEPQQPPIPLSLILFIAIAPMIMLCLGLTLLKCEPLIAAKGKKKD